MKRVLIHIGTPKTGSSSIQETLSVAADAGQSSHVCYPRLGARDHYFLPALYTDASRLPKGLKRRYQQNARDLARAIEVFRRGLYKALDANDDLILSAESLTALEPGESRAVIDDLVTRGVTLIQVLVYVRDPAALYLSAIQQRLKLTSVIPPPGRFRYRFMEAIDAWSTESSHVVVRPFDRAQLVGGDVVHDFVDVASRFFGQPILGPRANYLTVNESMSAEAMVALQKYQRLILEGKIADSGSSRELVASLQSDSASTMHTRPRLKDHWVGMLRSAHRQDLDLLHERFGVRVCPVDPTAAAGAFQAKEMRSANPGITVEHLLQSFDAGIANDLIARYIQNAKGSTH